MSRSGYVDDWDDEEGRMHLYRHAVNRAITGRRGQAFLREMAAAMDAMPERALIEAELINADGDCCAIGAVCKARGVDVSRIDPEDSEAVGRVVGIAQSMAAEIEYVNDEQGPLDGETPAQRWQRVRQWIDLQLQLSCAPGGVVPGCP